jgi:epoxyqueuosine reductase
MGMISKSVLTQFIRQQAKQLGFAQIGISKAEFMEPEAKNLEQWLTKGNHGKMDYMARYFDKRVDPTKLVPGAKSVISLLFNYFPKEEQKDEKAPKIARYAFGRDYHKVLKKKLKKLTRSVEEYLGTEINGRCFVDSAPVLERDWAKRSGLGWIGKNTLLIHPKMGSYFFLSEIISDLELDYDQSIRDHCGTCRKCIDACPTEAISDEGYILDGSKCISYLTIELKDRIPTEFADKMENWVFGCDICQEVCPWNRFSSIHMEDSFHPKPELINLSFREWHEITEDIFDKIFEGSAVKRTKFAGLKRNLDFLKSGNSLS